MRFNTRVILKVSILRVRTQINESIKMYTKQRGKQRKRMYIVIPGLWRPLTRTILAFLSIEATFLRVH